MRREQFDKIDKIAVIGLLLVAVLLMVTQFQIHGLKTILGQESVPTGAAVGTGTSNLADVDVTQIQSTAQGIAALFPLERASADEVIDIMIPSGTPDYGEEMGVSYDDPIAALDITARSFNALKQEVQTNDPEAWQRYIDLASNPRGVSCEYCCGIGPIGATKAGASRCGCKHNPSLLTITLWLAHNTDYSDAEILREVYRWKTMFFPKNMIGLGSQIAGGDTSVLENLPGMVGGC